MASQGRQGLEQKPDKKDAKTLLKREDRSTPQQDIGFMQEGGMGMPSELPADRHRLMLKRLEEPGRRAEKADFFKSLQQSYGNHYVQRLVSGSSSDRGTTPGGWNAIPSGGGQPLDKPVRNDMEGRFGKSFSNVRVHTDAAAGNAARSLGARAFATGQDIYFGRGAYQPASPQGRGLLAHELTHTIQQRGGRLGAQQALEVVPPDDPLEQQAEQASSAVMRDMRPAAPSTTLSAPILRSGTSVIQRQVAATPPPVVANARAPVQAPATSASWAQSATPALRLSGGQPLNPPLRQRLEKSFGENLGAVRVHDDTQAAMKADRLGAKAFAIGSNIVLGSGASANDVGLMAHEAAHTLQQRSGGPLQQFTSGRTGDVHEHEAQRASEAAVRGESFAVRQQTSPRMQGLFGIDISLPNPLNWLADKANIIPGFRMFTIILGVNPINMSPVARSAANILRALIEFLPGGGLITQALDSSGVFEKAGAFVEKQIAALGMAGSAIKAAVTAFISSLGLSDLANLGGVWERAKKIFTDPIDRIKSFGIGLVTGIVQIVKDAILKPIAKLAEGTNGYALLKAVMGRDPITGDPVPQTAEAIIEPFMKLIGEEEIWENMKKANAIPRAFAWFKGALSGLMGFVNQIPGLFVAAFRSLEILDIVLVPRAFAKLVGVFGGFLGKFISWAGSTIWNLLEIIFDVVSPGALGYIKKTGAALKSIFKNPLPFVGNLVKAAKLGFTNFADNFGGHLKAGLIDWLTGSLSGVYIPKALSLPELGKFAMSVLGITWAQIRGKIVKALGPSGETIMKGLETGFDIVVALVTGGPAAAWELIKEKLTELKDQVVSGIIGFVTDTVVKKAVPKLIAMFIPGAGFLSAIISIYDTVMVFVEKMSKIIQVVTAFIDSIVTIAAGNITAAAKRVESILGGLLSLAISFLAGFLGLGKVTDKIKEVIEKVRMSMDKAIDAAIAWIVDKAKKLFGGGKDKASGAHTLPPDTPVEGIEPHTLIVKEEGGEFVMKIHSAEEHFDTFLSAAKSNSEISDKRKTKYLSTAETNLKDIKTQLKALKKADEKTAKSINAELDKSRLTLAASIKGLLGGMSKTKMKNLEEKYLLEGVVGTYASLPKPRYDKLTPDHQPQASLIEFVSNVKTGKKKLFAGLGVQRIASNRAANGIAINLHFNRHIAGRTYGSAVPDTVKKDIEIWANKPNLNDQEKIPKILAIVTSELNADVKEMNIEGKPDTSHWSDIDEIFKDGDDPKENQENSKALKDSISKRIISGEKEVKSQDVARWGKE